MLHYSSGGSITPADSDMANHHGDLMIRGNGAMSGGGGGGSGSVAGAASSSFALSARNDDVQNSISWEYEEITLERGSSGLGFTVAGGIDNPHYKNDTSIYITRLIPNGPAALDGRLKLEDIIVRVDDISLISVTHSRAVSALKNSGNRVQLSIKRKRPFNNIINNSNSVINNSKNNITSSSKNNTSANNNINNQHHHNHSQNNDPQYNSTRLLTSASLGTHQQQATTNQLPPLPRGSQSSSAILRGSAQYSTTRETSTSSAATNRAARLKGASSSLSLQQTENSNDVVDHARATNSNSLSKENASNLSYSKSTSHIDFDVAKSLTRLPRTVKLHRTNKGLGLNIVGGVAGGGVFISYIVPGGPADHSNKLYCGDQILSVNKQDLRSATHEEAATTLKQAGQVVILVVKFTPDKYIKLENKINDLRERNMLSTGTLQTSQKRSLYARALFDYDPSKDSGLPNKGLAFKFGDILHITNASDDEWWRAKKVLEDGQDDVVQGIIPAKKRVEKRERARVRFVTFNNRNSSESMLDRRRKRFTFSKKFPFMKSRENLGNEFDDYNNLGGSQSNSRGILFSSSATSINNNNNNNNSERGSIRNGLGEDVILSYEPVLQHDIDYARPVAIYGAVKDEIEGIREDLSCDQRFYKMELIVPYTTRPPKEGEVDGVKYHFVSMAEMRRDIARHKFVEAGELNNNLYGTSIDSIREVARTGKHCILNISPKAIKKLHDANLYPVTLFIKPKSIDSLLEMNKRWSHEEAVAAMDLATRLEQEFGHYFTATIQSDSPQEILNEIMAVIAQQSGPRIWISTTFEALNIPG